MRFSPLPYKFTYFLLLSPISSFSKVHEVITARHCDMKVFAFSLITNMCYTEYETNEEANHDEVVTIGQKSQEKITKFVTKMVEEINFLINNNH